MREIKEGEQTIVYYDSLSELVDIASGRPGGYSPSKRFDDSGWAGTETFEEAQEKAFFWRDGQDAVSDIRGALKIKSLKQARTREYGMTPPGRIDVAAYSSRSTPYVFSRVVKTNDVQTGHNKVYKIAVNSAATAYYTDQQIMLRGAAILALLDLLESTGAKTELWVACSSKGGRYFWAGLVKLKGAGQALNLASVCFALASPGMNRRLWFGAKENAKDRRRSTAESGMGRGDSWVKDHLGPDFYWIPSINTDPYSEFDSVQSAREWAFTMCDVLGVDIDRSRFE